MKKLLCLLAVALLLGAAPAAEAQGDGATKKKLLLITESRGFRHDVVWRRVTLAEGVDPKQTKVPGLDISVDNKGKVNAAYNGRVDSTMPFDLKNGSDVVAKVQPCLVEVTMMELGKKTGLFDVTCSQDSRTEITAENLKNYDAIFFYTTGELPLSEIQKGDLLAFVRGGKGFGGSHCATDTFYKWKEYGDLIGAYFDGHPWHQKIKVIVEDKKHVATRHLGDSFEITDEIYQFRGPFSRDKLHVLMKLDMSNIKAGKREDNDNALAWTHTYGNGRVFYTALGHRDEVWRDPRFQQHVIGGLRYMFGLEK